MTENVLVSILGMQQIIGEQIGQDPDENEPIEVITPGVYHFRNGIHYIQYEEFDAEEQPLKVLLKLDPRKVEMQKRGSHMVHMIFEPGIVHTTAYQLPFGAVHMDLCTTELLLEENESELIVRIRYLIEIDHTPVSENDLLIHLTERPISKQSS